MAESFISSAPPLAGLPPLLAELRAAAEKRQTTPTSLPVVLTRKQMLEWDDKSLLAGQWRMS